MEMKKKDQHWGIVSKVQGAEKDCHLPYPTYYTSINTTSIVIAFGGQPYHTVTCTANLKPEVLL